MKTTLVLLGLLALGLALAPPASATCTYHPIVGLDPVPRDTGHQAIDDVYVDVGYWTCHPPPPAEDW